MGGPWRAVIEPFRPVAVEPLPFTTAQERERLLEAAGFTPLALPADKVTLDLSTDAGTGALSADQRAASSRGEGATAGRAWRAFERRARDLTGLREIAAARGGREAGAAIYGACAGPGKVFLSNAHPAAARRSIEAAGAAAVDLPVPEAWDLRNPSPFKGDVDARALEAALREHGPKNVPSVCLALTNAEVGGQPVSMRNLRDASEICSNYRVPLWLEASRFAENAALVQRRERGYASRAPGEIAREAFAFAQGCVMSLRMDAMAPAGGLVALNDGDLARRVRESLRAGEPLPAEGLLGPRDLEAAARGLDEAAGEEHLAYRLRAAERLAEALRAAGIPVVEPPGVHAVFVDAKRFLEKVPPWQYPALALAVELYRAAGIRAAEQGSFTRGRVRSGKFEPARAELLRVALPRRSVTQSQLDWTAEVLSDIAGRKDAVRGLKLLEGSEALPSEEARLAPL